MTSAALHGLRDIHDPQAGIGRDRPALRPGRETDDDVDPGFVEVQGVGVTLAAVPDDGDRLAGQRRGSASLS